MTDTYIGRYRVLRQLGAGGMGAVYEAVDEAIQRRVAIKVLHAPYAKDAEMAQRFFNEARAVNIVDHPGVVQVSEFGQLADGTAYLVMELLRGESLHAYLERVHGALPAREALRLGRQIALVLAAAHDKGIVHRDLKPANVMLVPDEEAGRTRVKLLDFGIAKVAAEYQAAGPQVHTLAGVMMGTPAYMAPEQCYGAAAVDAKADVYSLGVVLFQMLAGQPPFAAGSASALVLMQVQQPPPPLRGLDPTISEEVAALVHAMLAKDPAARPTMREVAEALAALSAPATTAPPVPAHSTLGAATGQTGSGPGTVHASRRWIVMGAVLAALGGGVAGWRAVVWQRGAASRPVAPVVVVPAAPPVPAMIHWRVESEPPGAQIVDTTGAVLGITPWAHEEGRGNGQVPAELRLGGYLPRRITLDRAADGLVHERLDPVPPPPGHGGHRKAAGDKKGHDGNGEANPEIPFRD